MNRQPFINSLSFNVGFYQVSCIAEGQSLKIDVSMLLDSTKKARLSLSKMISTSDLLSFQVVALQNQRIQSGMSVGREQQWKDGCDQLLIKKINEIEDNFKAFQSVLLDLQTYKTSSEQPTGQKERKSSFHDCPYFKKQAGQKIGQKQHDNCKMEMLNSLLQQKLLQKEGQIVSLEKKLVEREELVQQMADRLIVANSEKEDMLCEYEKILQTTVFSHPDEAMRKKTEENIVVNELQLVTPADNDQAGLKEKQQEELLNNNKEEVEVDQDRSKDVKKLQNEVVNGECLDKRQRLQEFEK